MFTFVQPGERIKNRGRTSCPKDTYGGPASGRLWKMTDEMKLKIVRKMNKAVFENC
jgi:hypothetical protein